MGYKAYPEYKESGVEWLPAIPEHWQVRRLKFMATIQNGCDYKAIERDHGVPVIGSGGQFTWASEFLYEGESVLFGRKGTIDKPLHINGKFWTVDTMFYSIIQPGVFGRYLYYYSTIFQYKNLATQTALPSITQHDLGNYLLCYPCFHEQQSIACFLDYKTAQIDQLMEKKKNLIEKLQEQRTAAITHAVTKGLDSKASMKDSGIERLGVVPAHWKILRLKDALVFQRGHDLPSELREDGSVPLVSSAGISATHSKAIGKAPGIVTGRYGTIGDFTYLEEDFWPLNTTLYSIDLKGNKGRRQKLSATPDLSGTVLPHVLLRTQR